MNWLTRTISPLRYHPSNPAGPWLGLFLVVALAIVYMVAQAVLAAAIAFLAFGAIPGDERSFIKAAIIATLPAAVLAAILAYAFALIGGGRPRDVLALKRPGLSLLQWLGIILGFMVGMYALMTLIMLVFNIDPAQYTPGPDGSSPSSGSAGLVKEAMYSLVQEPRLFALALLSVALGAPLAEEVIFRGQFFAILAKSPIGNGGAVVVSSILWALLHSTEPWLTIILIFIMGLVLGFLLLRFGSLWVTMVLHGVWNAVYSLLVFGFLTQ
jgi:uncharacterized protein